MLARLIQFTGNLCRLRRSDAFKNDTLQIKLVKTLSLLKISRSATKNTSFPLDHPC
jgi:hypothetical protein